MLPEIIYHYTSISAFKSMIRHKQLWLTHYKHVNDTEEIIAGLNILKAELKEYRAKSAKITSGLDFSEEIYDQYFLCFCDRVTNNHLWENYSTKSGLAVGFDTQALLDENPSIAIVPLSYNLDSYREICKENISKLLPISQDDEERLKEVIRQTKNMEAARKFLWEIPNYIKYRDTISQLAAYGTLFKNPRWFNEEEVRLVHWPIVCTESSKPLLNIRNKMEKPRAILQLKRLPIVSINTLLSYETIKKKRFDNFLAKHNLELAYA